MPPEGRTTNAGLCYNRQNFRMESRLVFTPVSTKQLLRLVLVVVTLSLMASCGACRRNRLPAKDSPAYKEYVRTFFVGLAALQAGDDARAKDALQRATTMVPGEPAAWINLAILELKQKLYDPSAEHLEKARVLAPEVGSIYFLQGTLESARGNYDAAVKNYRRAIELDPEDLRARYSLAQELERQGGPAEAEALNLYQQVLATAPNNTAAILEVARLAAKRGDGAALNDAIGRLRPQSAAWPTEVKEQFAALETVAGNPATAATQVAFLRNVMLRLPAFRQDSFALKLPPEIVAEPVSRFVKLAMPDNSIAAPDTALGYRIERAPTPNAETRAVSAVSLQLTGDGPPVVAWQDGQKLHLGSQDLALPVTDSGRSTAIVEIDLNYDFRTDLVLANRSLRFYQQTETGTFQDVTPATKLAPGILNGGYEGIRTADVDMDGDLDLILMTDSSAPVLQNIGDGSFTPIAPLSLTGPFLGIEIADLDGDGDPDIVSLDRSGKLSLLANERGGVFRNWAPPTSVGLVLACALADLNGDGRIDIVSTEPSGAIWRSSFDTVPGQWVSTQVVAGDPPANSDVTRGFLAIADLDNNGANDVVLPNSAIFLNAGNEKFVELASPPQGFFSSIADLNNDGVLDLVGITNGTQPVTAYGATTKNYHWQDVRPRAANATGDQRINPFGVGGEMELRAGLLYQKQIVNGPVVHFGLGDQPAADAIRVVWPNGSVQAEFDMKPNQSIAAEQRLKGSCPHLFAWDGKQMRFIKDAPPWSPALGLKINAQTTAGIGQTEEWFTLPGDAAAPAADGMYDLRITAELWETFYIDRYSLMVVDHPVGTSVFTDERFSIPAPALKVYATGKPQPFARATDDQRQDVEPTVAVIDAGYLDTFGRGQYQGVTRDHYVELQLPDSAPVTGPLYLLGQGWLHPTDASVNVALGQGHADPPRGLSIEIPDGRGGWRVAKDKLGFPAGKFKNVLLDLTDLFPAGTKRIFRLRTNLEIYWDRLAWVAGANESDLRTQRIELSAAELTHRGFSVMTKADASSPEIPHYDRIETTGQKWRDLEGYYTRFGDVRELLAGADGRFVLVNAGDEIRLRFAAPPPPPAGYVRDFVLIGNGWIKDGDLNSGFSRTVLPLPTLDMTEYTRAPNRLEDEPAYRAFPDDWRIYHTRYIAPDQFRNAMRLIQ